MSKKQTTIIHQWRIGPDGKKVPLVFCHVCGKDLTGQRATDIYPMADDSFSRELKPEECLCDECKSVPGFRVASYKCNDCGRLFFIGETSPTNPSDSIEAHLYYSKHICPECDPKRKRIYIKEKCAKCNQQSRIQVLTPEEAQRLQYFSQPMYVCPQCADK